RAIHGEHAPMIPAMARDLMPTRDDLAQQRSMALRNPAEREEGSLGVDLVEQVQNLADVAVDAVGEPAPVVALDYVLERADLEPVLDVDGQAVDDRKGALRPLKKRNCIHALFASAKAVRRPWFDPSRSRSTRSAWSESGGSCVPA